VGFLLSELYSSQIPIIIYFTFSLFPRRETMFASKHAMAIGLFMAAALIGVAGPAHGQGRDLQRSEVRAQVKSVDAAAGTITVSSGATRDATAPTDKTYSLSKNVEVGVGNSMGRAGIYREAKLADLSVGVSVGLRLSADQKTVEGILAEEPIVRGVLKSVDAKKNTLVVSVQNQREQPGEEKTFAVAPGADIAVDDGRGRRFSIKESSLDDLVSGALVSLRLSLDQKQVQGLIAEGALVFGILKSVDAAKKSITLKTNAGRGDEPEERILPVPPEGVVVVDDGRGRLLSVKEAKLADLPEGAAVSVKLSPDQNFAMFIRAEGPTLTGLFKGADPDKGTITIAIPKSREEVDEKTFPLTKDARIFIDAAESTLGNLKASDNGPLIQLRLSLDQKSVQVVLARQATSR
jgi:hypothetical protein